MRDFGLLVLRLFTGASLAAHGAQKLFGWFGGAGLDATAKVFEEHLGYAPGKRFALMAARSEMASGALIAAGALSPAASAAAISTMIVAAAAHADNGFFATNNGFELPAAYATMSAALALTGPGKFCFVRISGNCRWNTRSDWGARAAAEAGAIEEARKNAPSSNYRSWLARAAAQTE
jgi:putative oxidoreductase